MAINQSSPEIGDNSLDISCLPSKLQRLSWIILTGRGNPFADTHMPVEIGTEPVPETLEAKQDEDQ